MKIQGKGRQISPKALERICNVLATIERANPQINWDLYNAYVTVRKYWRWKIFSQRIVFIDVCLAPQIDREKETLEIPAGTFRPEPAWKKRPVAVHGGPKWAFRMRDLKAKKRHGKVVITMREGE